jgi:uncharacterized membrane protein
MEQEGSFGLVRWERQSMAAPEHREPQPAFPIAAGIFFGLGLGGFFDGSVLHQLLQWHHMLSSWFPVDSLENLELNTQRHLS